MDRRTLLLGTGVIAAMGVSAKALAMDASLPMKAADIDPAFEKAFNAGDLDTLLKLYDEQSVLVAEPGKPVQGLENIKKALMGYLALKLPIQVTVRHVYENGDIGFCTPIGALPARPPMERMSKSEGRRWRWSRRPRGATG